MVTHQQLEKQFQGMSQEEKTYLGVLGLSRVVDQELNTKAQPKPTFDMMGDYMDSNYGDEYESILIDDDSLETLVMMMKAETFKVRMVNAMYDLVDPLVEHLKIMEEERLTGEIKRHSEDMLYMQTLSESMEHMGQKIEGSLIRTSILSYQMFTRHPVWGTLRIINTVLGGLTKATGTILFGFKKEKSDTDRIVDSVDKLREFMMTGQVDQNRSTFSRIISGGLVGLLSSGLLKVAGVSRDKAQVAEDKRARGEQLDHMEEQSAKLFKDIVRRGRNGFGYVPPNLIDDTKPEDSEKDNDIFELRSDLIMYMENEIKPLLWSVDQSLMKILVGQSDGGEFSDILNKVMETQLTKVQTATLVSAGKVEMITERLVDIAEGHYTEYTNNNKLDTKVNDEQKSAILQLVDLNDKMLESTLDSEKLNKKQLREQRRLRMQNLLASLGTMATGIVTALGPMIGALATAAIPLLTNPIVLGTSAILGVGAAGMKWWEEAKERSTVSGKSQLEEFFDPSQSIIFSKLKGWYDDIFGTKPKEIIDDFTDYTMEKYNDIRDWIFSTYDSILDTTQEKWNDVKTTVFGIFTDITDWLKEKKNEITSFFSDISPSSVLKNLKEEGSRITSNVVNFTKEMFTVSESSAFIPDINNGSGVSNTVNTMLDSISPALDYFSSTGIAEIRDLNNNNNMSRLSGIETQNITDFGSLTQTTDKMTSEITKMTDGFAELSAAEIQIFGQMRDLLKTIATKQTPSQQEQMIQSALTTGIDNGIIGAVGY